MPNPFSVDSITNTVLLPRDSNSCGPQPAVLCRVTDTDHRSALGNVTTALRFSRSRLDHSPVVRTERPLRLVLPSPF